MNTVRLNIAKVQLVILHRANLRGMRQEENAYGVLSPLKKS